LPLAALTAAMVCFQLGATLAKSLFAAVGAVGTAALRLAIASLIYEGVLEAFPKVKICISHGGGYMPLCIGRIARNYLEKPTTRVNMKKSPDDYLRQLYYDSCVYDHDVLRHLVEKVGASQVILGSDYPVGEWKPIEFVRAAPGISDADKEKIIGLNAAAMFGVAVPA